MIAFLTIFSMLACNSSTPDETPTTPPEQTTQPLLKGPNTNPQNKSNGQVKALGTNMDQGQKHPPLPADNPAWEWDAQAFVPDFGWFGEHNWADVRMRVVGHLAMGYRDIARIHLLNQDWAQASATLQTMSDTLTSIDTTSSKFAEEIRSILIESAKRDLQILNALQGKGAFPNTNPDTLIHWRIAYWKLTQQQGVQDLNKINRIQQELVARFGTPKVSAIDEFDNFTDRHKLRTELFGAYVDSLDPLLPADLRWGYWRPTEVTRQAAALWMALEGIKQTYDGISAESLPIGQQWWLADDHPVLQHSFYQKLRELSTQNTIFTPSLFSYRLRDQQLDVSPAQLGRLPTGDTIIDVGGQPGPMGIGTLMKLDASDPDHQGWLTGYGERLAKTLQNDPTESVQVCIEAINALDAYTHGSRFYNVKQFRNACTRQLARMGHYQEALSLFNQSFPLHHQDWACPNREGLLLVIVGRLEALEHSPEQGLDTLQRSIDAGLTFLEKVSQAEQGILTDPKPPMMQVGNGGHKGKPPPHGQPANNIKGGFPPNHSPHKAGIAPVRQNPNPRAQ